MKTTNQWTPWINLGAGLALLAALPGCDVDPEADGLDVADSEGEEDSEGEVGFRYANPHLIKPNLLTSMLNDGNGFNGGCWDTAPGLSATFQQYPCHGKNNQRWMFDQQSDGTFLIKSEAHRGMCVDVPSGNAQPSQDLQLHGCHGQSNQRWTVVQESGSSASIRPVDAPGLCLSIEGAVQNAQADLELATCLGYDFQRWRFSAYNGEDLSLSCDSTVKFNSPAGPQFVLPGQRRNFVITNDEMKCFDDWFLYDNASCVHWAEHYVVDRPAGSDDVDVRCFNIQ